MDHKSIIAAWLKYGVTIEMMGDGYWSWAETDSLGNVNGGYSPPFSTFEACVADLEASFGPLSDQQT